MSMFGLKEVLNDTERLEKFTEKLIELAEKWKYSHTADRIEIIKEIIDTLQVRGTLTLLGIRKTEGSIDEMPPCISDLLLIFNEKSGPRGSLSEGARALSKHYHRGSDRFWGDCKGNDAKKNTFADEKVREIMRGAVWLNLHLLPHNVTIFEIRNNLGYGARWGADGAQFRGFLEPQMEDGHEKGWKH